MFGVDIITGLALLIIGCLSISGVIPCNVIVGGFMVGIGCLELVLAPLLAKRNCDVISVWNAA